MGKDVNDPSDLRGRARRQLAKVREDVDHDADREALIGWANDMLTRDYSPATVTNRLNPMKKLHERAEKPLVEFASKSEVSNLLAALGNGSHSDVPPDGLAKGTLRSYRQAAKLFYRDELGYEWGDDIVIGSPDPTPITEEDILASEDVDALLDASRNPRDAAMVSFLTVTGQRLSAMLSLRVGDIDLTQKTGTATLNPDATGLKGASGPRPLFWARPHIASWLSNHPRRDDDSAALFCTLTSGEREKPDGGTVSWDIGDVLSPRHVRKRLNKLAERADVPTEKVNPHNFRHTAITRMRDDDVGDDRIKYMIGVEDTSDILERYDKQSDERMMARLRKSYGMDVEEPGSDVGQPSMQDCPHCGVTLRSSARFCDGCGTPLSMDAAADEDATSGAVSDDMVSREDMTERRVSRAVQDDIDPDLVTAVADELEGRLDDH